jgi:site-specific DNA-methyltransferase (adenine-specific)
MPDALPVNQILLGKCLELLRSLPDNSIDSIVTDPPYGLGTKEPTPEEIDAYLKGASLDTGGDFMNADWEIPSVAVWKECLRVLKPGGYILSFAGTRTWDLMSIGIRVAGFDNRDTISSLFSSPCLQWVHGQGFPKSLNIAKAIRKLKKGENETESSDLATKWEGYGTALKPAWEPILCFRKPVVEGTVAEQVLATGTGGLNIGGTRVKHASPEDFAKHKEHVERIKEKGGQWGDSWKNSSDLSGASEVTTAGRWPANVALTHSSECLLVGTTKVDAPVINRFSDGMKPFGNGVGHPYESSGGGEEEISVYECAEGCPVKALDEQSGVTTNTRHMSYKRSGEGFIGSIPDQPEKRWWAQETGTASRFFTQFVPDAPFFYTGKATKKEKNAGILKEFVDGFVTLKDDLNDEQCLLLEEKWPAENVDPKSDVPEMAIPEELRELFEPVKPDGNSHPTVKPVALMQWLVRMVTPKDGIVLDPYCGSGTTCAAAVHENVKFIGMDKDPMFHKLAEKRIGYLLDTVGAHHQQRAAFDAMMGLPQED